MKILTGICVIYIWTSIFFSGYTLFNMAFNLSTSPQKLMLQALLMGVVFAWFDDFKKPNYAWFKGSNYKWWSNKK